MTNPDEKRAQKERAKRLREKISKLDVEKPDKQTQEPKGKESPREFVRRRMRDLEKKE